jgi:RNA polymerase sigma-54 factor
LEPPGLAALDLQECLLLQLQRADLCASLAYTIVKDHFELLKNRRYKEIAQALSTEAERVYVDEVMDALEIISKLNPRPGSRLDHEPQQYVEPEVFIVKEGDGFVAKVKEPDIPPLRITQHYKDMLAAPDTSAEVRNYIMERIRAAKALIEGLQRRTSTIQKVADALLRRQAEFFHKGPKFLRPLTMREVAEEVGHHETTISRAVSGKFMDTPHGVYEMRYLFTSGQTAHDGQGISAPVIKARLEALIKEEDPQKPRSDAELAKMLQAEFKIPLARRTVAKYREQLKILSSHLRRGVACL